MISTVKEPTTAPIGTKDIDIKHKILLLGSGLVTGPVVDYLMRDQSIRLTIGKKRCKTNDFGGRHVVSKSLQTFETVINEYIHSRLG
jgi:hypothetical protein